MRLLPRLPQYSTRLAVPFDVERVFLYLSSPESRPLALVQSLLASRCLRQIAEADELEVQTQGTRWRQWQDDVRWSPHADARLVSRLPPHALPLQCLPLHASGAWPLARLRS